LLLVLALGVAGGCGPRQTAEPEKEQETIARTEFTDRIENFFEYDPLTPGTPSRVLIHLTNLGDGAPVEAADVHLTVRAAAGGDVITQVKARPGRVTGIYVAEVTAPRPGAYTFEFHVKNARLDERMVLSDFSTR
jgi:5-hydroxyisourate hydrolase-like protein (transthyretin family)